MVREDLGSLQGVEALAAHLVKGYGHPEVVALCEHGQPYLYPFDPPCFGLFSAKHHIYILYSTSV